MTVDYKLIGTRIKEKRLDNHLTQEQLAEKLDVTVGYVSQLERGITKISLDTLAEICTILEADITYMISDSVYSHSSYLNSALNVKINKMSSAQKSMLFDLIDVIIKHE